MSTVRVTVSTIAVCLTAAAIGAAPVTKKQPAASSAPAATTSRDASDAESQTARTSPSNHEPGDVGVVDPLAPALIEQSSAAPELPASAGGQTVNMDWYSINNGGAIEVTSGNIKLGVSIGQNAVGEVAAGNIKMGLGFWYGASGSSAPTCACDCAHDPVCDGFSDILDVSAIVNVAFRNDAAIPDSNVLCPVVTTDVNCDDLTDIFDLTRMVNVAFRNFDPAVEFCDPCAPPNL